MANGYEPDKGTFLIPFDLKSDVIQPLERLEDGFNTLNAKLDAHLTHVDTSIKSRMMPLAEYLEDQIAAEKKREERRAKVKKVLAYCAGPVGVGLLAALGRVLGFSV